MQECSRVKGGGGALSPPNDFVEKKRNEQEFINSQQLFNKVSRRGEHAVGGAGELIGLMLLLVIVEVRGKGGE